MRFVICNRFVRSNQSKLFQINQSPFPKTLSRAIHNNNPLISKPEIDENKTIISIETVIFRFRYTQQALKFQLFQKQYEF